MSPAAQLREVLATRFPDAFRAAPAAPPARLASGIPSLDGAGAGGGLPRGTLTEAVLSPGSGALLMDSLLRTVSEERTFAALIDPADCFDPCGCHAPHLQRLLWVRCAGPLPAVRAADLLLRDGNLGLILLDLQMLAPREIQRVPASTWHRLQRLAGQTSAAFLILTPQPLVEGAQVRLAPDQPPAWPADVTTLPRTMLPPLLQARIVRRGQAVFASPAPRQPASKAS